MFCRVGKYAYIFLIPADIIKPFKFLQQMVKGLTAVRHYNHKYIAAERRAAMEQLYYEPVKRHPLRAVLGFFLTLIMTVLLISNGFLTALSLSVLKGNDLNSILKNTGFYDTVRSAVITELSGEKLGLSEGAIEAVLPDETLSKTVDKITDSLVNGTPFDISYIEKDCLDIAETTSNALLTEAFNIIDSHPVIDVKTISDAPAIADFEKNFGVDISSKLENTMISSFGTTTIDVSKIGTDKVKKQVSDTVSDLVYNTIEDTFDKYTGMANDLANDLIRKANREYKLNNMFKNFDKGLNMLHLAIIILYVIVIGLFIVQLLIYFSKPSGAFKNLSVCAFIASAAMFVSCGFLSFAADRIAKELSSFDKAEMIVKEFFETNFSAVNSGIICVGIVCAVVGVIAVVLAVVTGRFSKE